MIKGLIVLILIGISWGLVEASIIRVRRLDTEDTQLPKHEEDLKIVFVSDFQLDRFWGFQKRIMMRVIQRINDENPDLVILGGDYIHKNRNYKQPIFEMLKMIEAPKVGVVGNHDYYDIESVITSLKQNGVHVLINESMHWKGYTIYGTDDYRYGNPKIPPHLEGIVLGISHEPELFEVSPYSKTISFGLSGHHHGGQITLFGKYAPAVRSEFGQKFVYGLIPLKHQNIYVTSGIGGFPLRFFARPEIVVISL